MALKPDARKTIKFNRNLDKSFIDDFEEFLTILKDNRLATHLDLSRLGNELRQKELSDLSEALQGTMIESINFTGTHLNPPDGLNVLKLDNTRVSRVVWDKPEAPKLENNTIKHLDKVIKNYLKAQQNKLKGMTEERAREVAIGILKNEIPKIQRAINSPKYYQDLKAPLNKKENKKDLLLEAQIKLIDLLKESPQNVNYLKYRVNQKANELAIDRLEKTLADNKIRSEELDALIEKGSWSRGLSETDRELPKQSISRKSTIRLREMELELKKVGEDLKRAAQLLQLQARYLHQEDEKTDAEQSAFTARTQFELKRAKDQLGKENTFSSDKQFHWRKSSDVNNINNKVKNNVKKLKYRGVEPRTDSDDTSLSPQKTMLKRLKEGREVLIHDTRIFEGINDLLNETKYLLQDELDETKARFIPRGLFELRQDIQCINELQESKDFNHLSPFDTLSLKHLSGIPYYLKKDDIDPKVRDNNPNVTKNTLRTLDSLKEILEKVRNKANHKILKTALQKAIIEINHQQREINIKKPSYKK